MKISLLVANLSTNVVTRALPIAKTLQRSHEVEIIGPVSAAGVYPPYRDAFPYVAHEVRFGERRRIRSLVRGIRRPSTSVRGDVIYAFKPRATSFGSGLLAKARLGRPLVLDIDDWEAEPYYSASWRSRLGRVARFYDPEYCWWYNRLLEPAIKWADQRTVVSSFFQKRYGGVRLPQIVDTVLFDPDRYDREGLRRQWGAAAAKVILFTGNAIPHKGLDTLVAAIHTLRSPHVVLWVVGEMTPHLAELQARAGRLIRHLPPHPHERMPEFLSLCDVVVLPQKSVPYAEGQIPAKVVEAMAMAKPIIATLVSDLGQMLEGCGWTVPPGDVGVLAAAIDEVLQSRKEGSSRGYRAREKCIREYSDDAAAGILAGVLKGVS